MGEKLPLNLVKKFNLAEFVGNFEQLPANLFLQKFYSNKLLILESVLNNFILSNSIIPKIGIELEFYLLNSDKSKINNLFLVENFITDLKKKILPNSLIYAIEPEQGFGQIEVKTNFTSDLQKLCQEIDSFKEEAYKLANKKNLYISFAAQIFENDCGSATQFNISLHNKKDENLYLESETLENSIASLLHFTDAMIIFLAPNVEDYLRFDQNLNFNLYKIGKYSAPVNLSFGVDNRTCAIRIPSQNLNQKNSLPQSKKRLEYRIASANCDIYLSISAILLAISQGRKQKLNFNKCKLQKIYGNAFDKSYNLKEFCKNYEQAMNNFIHNNIFKI